jgi:phosphoglycolate phosphatase
MHPPPYQLISFDLDGTLVDTAAEIAKAANVALEAHGIAARTTAEITALIGAGTRELMLDLLARCTLEQPSMAQTLRPEAVLASFDRHYARTTGTHALPYEGCRSALTRLKQAGVRLACTTNKELRHTRRVLAATQLDAFFDLVVGGDSLPEKKPHRSVLEHVMNTLKAGVSAWGVPYGYNRGQPIASANPDRVFASLLDVAHHALAARAAL